MKPGAAETAPLLQNETTNYSIDAQASTVIPYKKVRYGPSKGEIYLKPGITRMQQNLAYWQTYWQSMGWLFLVICCLTLMCSCGVLYYLRVVRVGIACHVHVASMAPRVTPSTRCPTQEEEVAFAAGKPCLVVCRRRRRGLRYS